MKLKNTISIFLVLIFIGKLTTIDAKGFKLLLEMEGISMVNKMCLIDHSSDVTLETDFSAPSQQNSFEFDFMCQSPVQLSFIEWIPVFSEDNFNHQFYRDPGLLLTHSDKFYPPPRV